MSYTRPQSVRFGASYAGLSTVGYQLLDMTGTPVGSRVTAGVVALGGGTYGAPVVFPDLFDGWIQWDTGGGAPVYASDDVMADNTLVTTGDDGPIQGEEYVFVLPIFNYRGEPVESAVIDSGLASGTDKFAISCDFGALANSVTDVVELGKGLYKLTITAAESTPDVSGVLCTTTVDAVNTPFTFKPKPAQTLTALDLTGVEAEIAAVNATIDAIGGDASGVVVLPASPSSGPTLTELRTKLRKRLHDETIGNYPNATLDQCINTAYKEMQVMGRCNRMSLEASLLAGDPFVDLSPLFEVTEASIGENLLTRTDLAAIGGSNPAWNQATAAVPTKWAQMTGSIVRVHPTPDIGYTMRVHGFGQALPLSLDGDIAYAVPSGFNDEPLLDIAEREARKMRLTTGANASIVPLLMQAGLNWIAELKKAMEGA